MTPLMGVLLYIGTYRLYVEILNNQGLKTGLKDDSKWQKSMNFPYWDNWSWTHLIYGGLAAIFKFNFVTIFSFSIINEFFYEPYRCHKYSQGDKTINYAKKCDPLGHKVADTVYTLVGYELLKRIRLNR